VFGVDPGAHHRGELVEAPLGHRGENVGAIFEVVVRRLVGDLQPPRHLAQAQPRDSLLGNQPDAGVENGVAKLHVTRHCLVRLLDSVYPEWRKPMKTTVLALAVIAVSGCSVREYVIDKTVAEQVDYVPDPAHFSGHELTR